jgi:hypothetical protein
MAHTCKEILCKDELLWLVTKELDMEIDDDEHLDTILGLFYCVHPVYDDPEQCGAILVNKITHERYIVPDYYL